MLYKGSKMKTRKTTLPSSTYTNAWVLRLEKLEGNIGRRDSGTNKGLGTKKKQLV